MSRHLSGNLRVSVEKLCFSCIVGASYQVINALQLIKVYSPGGAKQNREAIMGIAERGDKLSTRERIYTYWWTVPDNFKTPTQQMAILSMEMEILQKKWKECNGAGHHKVKNTFALEELNLIKVESKRDDYKPLLIL